MTPEIHIHILFIFVNLIKSPRLFFHSLHFWERIDFSLNRVSIFFKFKIPEYKLKQIWTFNIYILKCPVCGSETSKIVYNWALKMCRGSKNRNAKYEFCVIKKPSWACFKMHTSYPLLFTESRIYMKYTKD